MKSLVQILLTTCTGFALGCALMYDDEELMLIAGSIGAVMIFTTYLILFVSHTIYKRLKSHVSIENCAEEVPSSLLGFDSRGTLKIESSYRQE